MDAAATSDPTPIVFANYLTWKGEPLNVARTAPNDPNVSPNFGILEYASAGAHHVYCTAGASYTTIPHSHLHFKSGQGVRFEYIVHALPQHKTDVYDLLFMIAAYPFVQNFEYFPGCVLPLGTDATVVAGSSMNYLYFTYPYLDDPKIYESEPHGQIKLKNALIQTLWVFPIHESEAAYIRTAGIDEFEDVIYKKRMQAHDFFRAPVV